MHRLSAKLSRIYWVSKSLDIFSIYHYSNHVIGVVLMLDINYHVHAYDMTMADDIIFYPLYLIFYTHYMDLCNKCGHRGGTKKCNKCDVVVCSRCNCVSGFYDVLCSRCAVECEDCQESFPEGYTCKCVECENVFCLDSCSLCCVKCNARMCKKCSSKILDGQSGHASPICSNCN